MAPSESDGREDDEGDAYEDDYESDGEGLVHPLPALSDPSDPTKSVETDGMQKPKVLSTPVDLESSSAQSEASLEDGERPGFEQCEPVPDFSDEIVRLHARRSGAKEENEPLQPPPAPATAVVRSESAVNASIQAQKRVSDYRRSQLLKEEQIREERARELHSQKEAHRIFKPFNRTIGVADVPPSKRYEDAMRTKRQEKKMKEEQAATETANRWYRKIQRQSKSRCSAGDYGNKILNEARKDHRAKLKQREQHRQTIEKKLKQLSVEAKKIIVSNIGAYERGSFILKVPRESPSKRQPGINTQE